MTARRPAPARGSNTGAARRRPRQGGKTEKGRSAEAPHRKTTAWGRRRERPTRGHQQRPHRSAPQTAPIPRPLDDRGRPKSSRAAQARANARKAKAPKVVRPPLRQRLAAKLAAIELDPRVWASRVPFVVLVIGSLGLGLGVTLWLSTGAAERSYQLGNIREVNQVLLQQKEALEREVLEAQAAPALAEAARELGMIPSRDTARLVQDPAGHWVVVGTPKPAEGAPPPPLNTPLPERTSVPPPPPPAPSIDEREVPVRVPTPGDWAPGDPTPGDLGPQPHLPGPVDESAAVPLAVPGVDVPHGMAAQQAAPGPAPAPAAPVGPVPAPALADGAHPLPDQLTGPIPDQQPAELSEHDPPAEHFGPVTVAEPEPVG